MCSDPNFDIKELFNVKSVYRNLSDWGQCDIPGKGKLYLTDCMKENPDPIK